LFQDWEAGREAQAVEKLLTLVALAGWTQDEFEKAAWASLSPAKVREIFGADLDVDQRRVIDSIRNAATAREQRVAEHRDETASLAAFLDTELPPNAALVFTASAVDGRKKIVKRIQELGGFVALTVERERSGALARQAVDDLIKRVVGEFDKRVDGAAHEQIVQRAGADAASLASELEKLCLYVGERDSIGENDVRAVFIDMAESWIFDFTSALAARRLGPALQVLLGLLNQREPPLRLLAMIAREVRMLLVARECLETTLRGRWQRNINYNAFQERVVPQLDEATRRTFGNAHPFVLFRRFQDAATIPADVLREALVRLSALDLQLKSSAGDPVFLMQAFVIDWCRGFHTAVAAR
jgi:DNA polymerase-3 subunit delta